MVSDGSVERTRARFSSRRPAGPTGNTGALALPLLGEDIVHDNWLNYILVIVQAVSLMKRLCPLIPRYLFLGRGSFASFGVACNGVQAAL